MTTSTITSNILPPPDPPGPLKWIKDNLFGSLSNTILTILATVIGYFVIVNFVVWLFTEANFAPITNFPMLYLVGQYPREELWRVGLSLSLAMLVLGISWGKWEGLLRSLSFLAMIVFALFAVLPVAAPELSSSVIEAPSGHLSQVLNTSMRLYLFSLVVTIYLGRLIGRIKAIQAGLVGALWIILPVVIMILFSGFRDNEVIPKVNTTLWGGLMVTFLLAFGG
ncbi:MAG: hypothetical protein N2D54_12690, partial [Chloroflexota bacterium]